MIIILTRRVYKDLNKFWEFDNKINLIFLFQKFKKKNLNKYLAF